MGNWMVHIVDARHGMLRMKWRVLDTDATTPIEWWAHGLLLLNVDQRRILDLRAKAGL